jgi:hypothetical protein
MVRICQLEAPTGPHSQCSCHPSAWFLGRAGVSESCQCAKEWILPILPCRQGIRLRRVS